MSLHYLIMDVEDLNEDAFRSYSFSTPPQKKILNLIIFRVAIPD